MDSPHSRSVHSNHSDNPQAIQLQTQIQQLQQLQQIQALQQQLANANRALQDAQERGSSRSSRSHASSRSRTSSRRHSRRGSGSSSRSHSRHDSGHSSRRSSRHSSRHTSRHGSRHGSRRGSRHGSRHSSRHATPKPHIRDPNNGLAIVVDGDSGQDPHSHLSGQLTSQLQLQQQQRQQQMQALGMDDTVSISPSPLGGMGVGMGGVGIIGGGLTRLEDVDSGMSGNLGGINNGNINNGGGGLSGGEDETLFGPSLNLMSIRGFQMVPNSNGDLVLQPASGATPEFSPNNVNSMNGSINGVNSPPPHTLQPITPFNGPHSPNMSIDSDDVIMPIHQAMIQQGVNGVSPQPYGHTNNHEREHSRSHSRSRERSRDRSESGRHTPSRSRSHRHNRSRGGGGRGHRAASDTHSRHGSDSHISHGSHESHGSRDSHRSRNYADRDYQRSHRQGGDISGRNSGRSSPRSSRGSGDNQTERSSRSPSPTVSTFVVPRLHMSMAQIEDAQGNTNQVYKVRPTVDSSKAKNPLYYNQITCADQDDIIISRFPDARVIAGKEYFTQTAGVKDGLVIVIPFFNEPATELEATLSSLHRTYMYLCHVSEKWRNKSMNICMVQDGWYKADPSMQRYIKKIYPKRYDNIQDMDLDKLENPSNGAEEIGAEITNKNSKYWWEYHKEFYDYDKRRDGSVTFVFEKQLDNPSFFRLKFPKDDKEAKKRRRRKAKELGKKDTYDPKAMESQARLTLSCIIKIDNRRKHNSHEWFMGESGYADAMRAKYLFATDAFTLFEPKAMHAMITYLDRHDNCVCVTGRQRAMTRGQQAVKRTEWRFSVEYMLRLTQTFDFELTNAIFNPCYTLVGFLPVVPGPCGLYRCREILQNQARYWYFDIVNAEPTQTGLVLGNLRIAEDRILTYAAVLKVDKPVRMAFVSGCLFFFEAETNLGPFIFQRRRWINGTYAGFLYILFTEPYHFWTWNTNPIHKFIVWVVLITNFLQMSTMVVSPAISFTVFETSISYLFSIPDATVNDASTLTNSVIVFVWVLWIGHVVFHNGAKFHAVIVKILYFLSLLISFSLIITYFFLFVVQGMTVYKGLIVPGMSHRLLDYILGLMAFGSIIPLVCGMLVGGMESCLTLLKSTVAYFFSFHLMIPWFSSYAFTRCWDLSWGNRPASSEIDENEKDDDQEEAEHVKAKFLQYSRIVAFFLIVANLGTYMLPLYWKVLAMAAFLFCTAIFMLVSFFVLLITWMVDPIYENCCIEQAYDDDEEEEALKRARKEAEDCDVEEIEEEDDDDDEEEKQPEPEPDPEQQGLEIITAHPNAPPESYY